MVCKLLKKGISLAMAFAALLSLSCCGVGDKVLIDEITAAEATSCEAAETTPEETTAASLSEEELDELAQNMPEIVFVLSCEESGWLYAGFYVTNTGEIKLYDFRPFESSYSHNSIPDIYDKLEEAACDVLYDKYNEKIVSADDLTALSHDELVGYYKRLLLIEGDAERFYSCVVYPAGWGIYRFYGIKNNDKGEKECIILYGEHGDGDYYIHSNPDAEDMYAEFIRFIPLLQGRME